MKKETGRCVRDGVRCAHSSPSPSNDTRGYHICNYFLDTGMKRGCPAGEECDRYVKHWARGR